MKIKETGRVLAATDADLVKNPEPRRGSPPSFVIITVFAVDFRARVVSHFHCSRARGAMFLVNWCGSLLLSRIVVLKYIAN